MIEILQELVFNNKMINHAFVNVFQSERIMFFKSDGLTLGTPPGYSLSSDFSPKLFCVERLQLSEGVVGS